MQADDEEPQSVVLHDGSYNIKVGLGNVDAPSKIFRNVLAKPKRFRYPYVTYVGKDALDTLNRDPSFTAYWPIEHGVPSDFDAMESVSSPYLFFSSGFFF